LCTSISAGGRRPGRRRASGRGGPPRGRRGRIPWGRRAPRGRASGGRRTPWRRRTPRGRGSPGRRFRPGASIARSVPAPRQQADGRNEADAWNDETRRAGSRGLRGTRLHV